MDKAEYAFKLKSGLLKYPESFRSDVIASFEEHYAREIEKGKRPSEILRELGDPELLLKDIVELYGKKTDRNGIDAVFVLKNREMMRSITDYRMGAAILIPLLLVIFYVLHSAGVI